MRKFLVYGDKILSLLIVHSIEIQPSVQVGSYDLHLTYITCQLDNPTPKTFSYCWRLPNITTERQKELFKERLLKFIDDDPLHSRQSIFKIEEEARQVVEDITENKENGDE